MICSSNYKKLKEARFDSLEKLRNTNDKEEIFALYDFGNSINIFLDCNSTFIAGLRDRLTLFIYFFDYDYRTNQYDLEMANGFIKDLDYHRFLLKEVSSALSVNDFSEAEIVLSDEEFVEIIKGFMNTLGLDDLVGEFLENRRIIDYRRLYNDIPLGFCLHNNVDDESFICIKNFKNTISCMNTLVHELGHVYDAKEFFPSLESKNDYFYLSLYSEIIPYTFERLLVYYLIHNNIYVEEAQKVLEMINYKTYSYSLLSYIFSLSDSNFLSSHISATIRGLEISKDIKKKINYDSEMQSFLDNNPSFNLRSDCIYAYGYILSLFFSEEILKSKSLDCFQHIFQRRDEVFDISLMDEMYVNPVSFKMLTQKEKQLLKK